MTTEKDINDQINVDIQKFHTARYEGELPSEFIDYYKRAVMVIPPALHKIGMIRIEEMAGRKVDDVPFLEVGLMINIIFAAPFDQIYKSLEEGIEITKKFEVLKKEYNKIGDDFEQKCYKKRQRLLQLSGITRETVPFNAGIVHAHE